MRFLFVQIFPWVSLNEFKMFRNSFHPVTILFRRAIV